MTWRQGIECCKRIIQEDADVVFNDCRFLSIEEASVLQEQQPILQREGFSLYSAEQDRTVAVFHPWSVYVETVSVKCGFEKVAANCQKLLAKLPLDFGEHPDLFLSANPSLRGIVCLYIRRDELSHAQMRRLVEAVVAVQAPAHLYQDTEGLSFLWSDLHDINNLLLQSEEKIIAFGAFAGFSGPCELPASARGLMTKARLATEQREIPGIIFYTAVRWDLLWEQADRVLEGTEHSPAEFFHNAIAQMAKSDRDNGTEYILSLSVYLRSGRRLREASEQLNIHRNTLDYRIRRICELFGVDIQNASICFELLFSIHLLERYGEKALPMQTEAIGRNRIAEIRSLLWDSIEGRAIVTDVQGGCALLMINISDQTEETLRQGLDKAHTIFPESALAFDDDAMYLAILEDLDGGLIGRARKLLTETNLNGVLIPVFPVGEIGRRAQLLRLYQQVIHSLAKKDKLVFIQEYLSDLFFLLLQSRKKMSPYYCDQVIQVMDLDYENDSDLSGSLYAYLTNFMDMGEAAAAISIHRNTLEYHLKKIMPLIGGMPGEQLRFEMICTFRMLLTSDFK